MFCVDVVGHKQLVHQTLFDELYQVVDSLAIGDHVHTGVELIEGALGAKKIVLNVAAQFGKLQQLIDVENGT